MLSTTAASASIENNWLKVPAMVQRPRGPDQRGLSRPGQERLQKHGGIVSAVIRRTDSGVSCTPITFCYLFLSLLFAGLYVLDPQAIAMLDGPTISFAEAFFFSVHTLDSIG